MVDPEGEAGSKLWGLSGQGEQSSRRFGADGGGSTICDVIIVRRMQACFQERSQANKLGPLTKTIQSVLGGTFWHVAELSKS